MNIDLDDIVDDICADDENKKLVCATKKMHKRFKEGKLTDSELDHYVNAQVKIQSDAALELAQRMSFYDKKEINETFYCAIAWSLHNEFGWGATRIKRVVDSVEKTISDLDEGYLTCDDIKKTVRDECKFDVNIPLTYEDYYSYREMQERKKLRKRRAKNWQGIRDEGSIMLELSKNEQI